MPNAAALGADGVIVSNHGGRQLDSAPAALEILPAIRAAVPAGHAVMLDGGIRRGADIVIAKCLGADFVFLGRATLYGAIAGAEAGADRAIAIIRDEMCGPWFRSAAVHSSLDATCLMPGVARARPGRSPAAPGGRLPPAPPLA